MEAAWPGKAAAVCAVLGLGVKNKEARNEESDTAFLVACNKGSAECVSGWARQWSSKWRGYWRPASSPRPSQCCGQALAADPGSATLLALQRQVADRLEKAEEISREKEAELLCGDRGGE